MDVAYDPTTDQGKVRLGIADTGSPSIFSDDEIQAFLDENEGSLKFAIASGLESLAALYARRSSKLQVLDIQVDFSGVAASLMAQAKQVRQSEYDSTAFAFAEPVEGGFARQERRIKEFERTQE